MEWDGTGRDSRDLPNNADFAGSIPVGPAGEARAELARKPPRLRADLQARLSSEVEAAPTLFFLTEVVSDAKLGSDGRPPTI